MSVASKYDLGPVLAQVMTDPGEAILSLHNLAVSLADKVKATDTPTDSETKVNPLAAKYEKDEAGQVAAVTFLRENVFGPVTDYVGEDPGRTFHVLNAVSDLLVKYLRNEADFFKNEMTPKSASIARRGEYKADFNEVLGLIRNVAGMAEAVGYDCSTSEVLTEDSAGKPKSILPGFRGTKANDDGTVTGRYAKVYGLDFVIDGTEVDEGWTIPDIVRQLWHGPERIGKNAKNLTDILDSETSWNDPKFETATFTVNGHKVTVTRTVTGD